MSMTPAYSHHKLRRARLVAGRTIEELAQAAGLSGGALYRIEAGTKLGPRPTTVAALAAALGRPIEDFLNDEAGKEVRNEDDVA
jgi:transcriptional regulator with XRE-family HTH domain